MEKKYILSIDAGTTSNRAIIFDNNANIVAISQKEFTQYFPKPSWVEHDANEVWNSVCDVIKDVIKKANILSKDIAGIGITNQRETTVLWNKKTGEPIYNAIVWQSRQSSYISEKLKKDGLEKEIKYKTGLPIDAYFSATKIMWILENVPNAKELAKKGELLFGTIDTWLIWKLTGGKVHATDYTNASRTMIYNIRDLCWDEDLLKKFNIPASILPKVYPSSFIYGKTNTSIFETPVKIAGVAGDQQSALFGQQCFKKGMAKNTYGTGCFLLMNIGDKIVDSQNGLVTTIACVTNDKIEYALEGSVFVGGSVVQWLRDSLSIIRTASETENVAMSVQDSGGVYFVPAFVGLGAPYWDEEARGTIIGLTRGTTKAHIVRASLEAISYQTKDVLDAMEKDTGIKIISLNVDGGATSNDFLMQFQSDILGIKVCKSFIQETTALGACYLAGLSLGIWKDKEDIEKLSNKNFKFLPTMKKEKATLLYNGWKKAVEHAKGWVCK